MTHPLNRDDAIAQGLARIRARPEEWPHVIEEPLMSRHGPATDTRQEQRMTDPNLDDGWEPGIGSSQIKRDSEEQERRMPPKVRDASILTKLKDHVDPGDALAAALAYVAHEFDGTYLDEGTWAVLRRAARVGERASPREIVEALGFPWNQPRRTKRRRPPFDSATIPMTEALAIASRFLEGTPDAD